MDDNVLLLSQLDGPGTPQSERPGMLRTDEILQVAAAEHWQVCAAEQLPYFNLEAVGRNCRAVLVLCELAWVRALCQHLMQLMSECRPSSAIVVVILDPDNATDEVEDLGFPSISLMGAQQALLEAKADDVICNHYHPQELRRDVMMAIVRSVDREIRLEKVRRMGEQREQQNAVKLRRRLRDRDEMFWTIVHNSMEGFPRLDYKLDREVAVGSKVGPCTVVRQLSKGSVGTVYLGCRHEGQAPDMDSKAGGVEEAVKVLEKSRVEDMDDVVSVWLEVSALAKLGHRNVVSLYEALHTQHQIVLRMEYIGSQNLFQAMRAAGGKLPQDVAADLFLQLSGAVAHCHSQEIAHRDLKPENLVVSDDCTELRVCDFGCAVPTDETYDDLVGTMPFMPPELLAAGADRPYHAGGLDIWASGVILLEMLAGIGRLSKMLGWKRQHEPCQDRAVELQVFFQRQPEALGTALKEGLGHACPRAEKLLDGMLQMKPRSRWPASQVEAFVLEGGWLAQASLT